MSQVQHTLNLVLAGDSGIGKTEFANVNSMQFSVGKPGSPARRAGDFLSTVGVDFFTTIRTHDIGEPPKHVSMRYTIWDTAGTERFRACIQQYFRSADAVILSYDLTSRSTFQNLMGYWWPMVEMLVPNGCRVFIMGTKADILGGDDMRQVDRDEVMTFSKLIGAPEFETDSLQEGGRRAYMTFNEISRLIALNPPPTKQPRIDLAVDVQVTSKKKKGCRCAK